MSTRADWDERNRGKPPGAPEPFLLEVIPMLPRGLALDVAAARGRNALAMARAGIRVVAVDYSVAGLHALAANARAERLPVFPVVADFGSFQIADDAFDAIVNINYLDRALFPAFARGLKRGGVLLADTFLIDQAATGHPRNPDFMLQHYELRDLLAGLEILRYREGLTIYPDGTSAWRASALARRES
ncbi:MAG TPA: class I SAM-dependent methyltransferase [Candidatus Binataceae bacterium]